MNIEIIEWLEACKYKSPISEEQECRLGPKRSPGITEEDPQEQWEFKGLGSNGHTRVKKSLVMAKFMKTVALEWSLWVADLHNHIREIMVMRKIQLKAYILHPKA